jgi:hypothetical protein
MHASLRGGIAQNPHEPTAAALLDSASCKRRVPVTNADASLVGPARLYPTPHS